MTYLGSEVYERYTAAMMNSRPIWIALAAAMLAPVGTGCDGGDESAADRTPLEEGAEKVEGTICGTSICENEIWDGFEGELCCRSVIDGVCGIVVEGTCIDVPTPPDPRCESVSFEEMGERYFFLSCCTESGECGLRVDLLVGPMECVSITDIGGGGDGLIPAAKNCDGSPVQAPGGP